MLLQRTDCFHKCTFKVITDTHNFSGCFHLCCQCTFCTDKFIKWKSRDLYNAIVKHWLETCIGLLRNCILNLIQCISKCDLCSNFRNWISGCFGSQCRRTAYTRIYLDNTVLKCVRIQRILYVTSSGNIQLADNVQRGSSQHLVLLITQCLGRCNYNTVTGMHTNRINIFHITYSNAVSIAVTHHFILNLFPSSNTTLYQYLSDTGKSETIFQNLN